MKQAIKDHVLYVAKVGPNRFKYGVTRNVTQRLKSLTTTGYGKVILIGETTELCTKRQALNVESIIKKHIVRDSLSGEYSNLAQITTAIKLMRTHFGFNLRESINVEIGKLKEFAIGYKISVNITQEIINNSTCETTCYCMYAQALRLMGFAVPSVQANGVKFSYGGKRYTCITPSQAMHNLIQFDVDKSKIKPHRMVFEVVKFEDIVAKNYMQPTTNKLHKKVKKNIAGKKRLMSGRHHGLKSVIDKIEVL